jgi:serine protease Do
MQIVAKCEPSVALLKGRVSVGTGFVIKRGIVATNAHVIEDELLAGLEIRFPSASQGRQGPLPAELLYEDRKRDVAFLQVATDLPPLELAPSYVFQKGEDVTVIGNPGLGDEVVLENAISRGVMSAKTVIEGMNYFQLSIAINPGNSGGPVFDSSGRVIGVATLKANRAESMGFCIPVDELKAASSELGRPHPEMVARHRAVATFNALTLAFVIYLAGIVGHAGQLGAPQEQLEKLYETVQDLDEKLFSQVDVEISGLQTDHALSPRTRRNYQELSANYKAMKQIYGYPAQQANQYARHVQDLRKQHYNLVVSIRDELQVEVPDKLLAVLQEPAGGNQQQVVVVEMLPRQMQPGQRRFGPGRLPRGPGMASPGQALHNQMMRQMQQQQRQMQNRLRNFRPPGPP